MSDAPAVLHPVVETIRQRFEIVDDELCLPDAAFQTSWDELGELPPAQRETVGEQLLALALLVQRQGQGAGAIAIAQLFLMVGRLLSDFVRAQALFEGGGVDLSKAQSWIGQQQSKLPVQTGSISGGSSLFALRLKKDK